MIYIYIGFICIIYNRILFIQIIENKTSSIKLINLSLIPLYAYITYDFIKYIIHSNIFKVIVTNFSSLPFIAILISLTLTGTLFARYYQNSYTENLWGKYKNYIFEDKKMGLVIFLLVILIGMIGAGIVNFFTTEESERLSGFVIGGITGLFVIFLGYCLITPPIVFWLDYKHLAKFPTDLAEIIQIINKRAKASLNIVPGIQSIELFEVKEKTINNNIHYQIDNIWENKHKNSNVGKFKHNSTSVSVDFNYKFFKDFDVNKQLPIELLNQYSNNGNTISLVYLNALIDFLNEISADNNINFENWIKGWKIPSNITDTKYLYRSINYLLYFKPINAFEIKIKDKKAIYQLAKSLKNGLSKVGSDISQNLPKENTETLFEGDSKIDLEIIAKHLYLRNKSGGNSYKKDRQYYNFYFKIIHPTEGEKRFVILITADKRLINFNQICLVCQTMIK